MKKKAMLLFCHGVLFHTMATIIASHPNWVQVSAHLTSKQLRLLQFMFSNTAFSPKING